MMIYTSQLPGVKLLLLGGFAVGTYQVLHPPSHDFILGAIN